ncbi:ABC transporter substrate-binding protein [Devosia nitrariae]|uniref:ABC transporter substrate-binding protein n=1 Tax=Devosia nitrariae TaxID=2071872 RepID=A0ABQ5W7T9_9HYPH|nr:ABC transporter substrate-binding protein [Devosia nitrariae]GLQ56154.1 ABC transporter substrate-binding protein [Devosia nitrariae]
MRRFARRLAYSHVVLAGLLSSVLIAPSVLAQTAIAQAPMLDAMEELPPVADRVGSEPMVIVPVDGVRTYGGNLRQVYQGAGDESWLQTFYHYEPLMRWNNEMSEVLPNIAEGYEVNADATEYIFDLREGMKWSDGEPFTAADIVFWAEHVQFNDNIDPLFRLGFLTAEDELKVEAIDDYTVKFTFGRSKSMLPLQLATNSGIWLATYPRHYMEQFHPDFNANAEEEALAAGFTNWEERFMERHNIYNNLEKPVITPWVYTRRADDTEIITMERNPYYWKIDDQGNQLPYLDGSTIEVVKDFEVMLLKVLNGEVDYNARYVNTPANRAVMFDNEAKAGLKFFEIVNGAAASPVQIHLNQTARDPVLKALFSNRDVRIALSVAIDRQEIIDIVYAGQGTPHQISPRPEEKQFYDEEMGTQFTQYDPEMANQLLDAAGYDKRDANGWRLSPDGQPINFVITTRADRQPYVDMLPFLEEDWRAIGFNVQSRSLEKAAKDTLRNANEHHVLVDDGDGASMNTYVFPRAYVPLNADSAWMTGWVHWAVGGADPQEPPQWMKDVIALHEQMQVEPDLEKQADLYRQILAIHKEQFNILGLGLPVNGIGVHRLQNVPSVAYASSAPLFPGPTQVEQYAAGAQ